MGEDLVIVLGYCFACFSLGALLLRFLAPNQFRTRSNVAGSTATAFLLGQGILASVLELIALAGAFTETVILAIVAICVLAGAWFARIFLLDLLRVAGSGLRWFWQESILWKTLILLTLVLIAITGVLATLPPSARGDSLAFYFALPKVIASSQKFLRVTWYGSFAQVGLLGEFHFAALMLLKGAMAAKMFVWAITLSTGLILIALGKEIGMGRRGQWIALSALFTSSTFLIHGYDGKVDLFGAGLGLAAYYWAVKIDEHHLKEKLCLTGLFVGLGIIAKFSYVPFLPPSVLLIVLWRYWLIHPRPKLRSIISVTVQVGLWAALITIPHFIKNTVLFHEPLAPVIGSNPENDVIIWQSWFDQDTTRRILLTYPFALIFTGRFTGGGLSALYLALAPLVLLMPRSPSFRRSPLVQLLAASIVATIIWTIYRPTVFAPRYIMAPLLLLILPGALGAEYVFRTVAKNHILLWATGGAIAATVLMSCAELRPHLDNAIRINQKQVSECQLETVHGIEASCRIAQIVNQEAQPGDRIYLASYYSYWLRPDLLQCVWYNPETHGLLDIQTSEERWAHLYDQGYKYLMIDTVTHAHIQDALDVEAAPDWLHVEKLFDRDNYLAYRLDSSDPNRRPQAACRPKNSHVWQVIQVQQ